MQMQTNVTTKTNKPVKKFNLGDTVSWKSHANGITTRKVGKVVAVIPPGAVSHPYDYCSKEFIVSLLRETRGLTRDAARSYYDLDHFYSRKTDILSEKYKLKFAPGEGYYDTFRYLVEVDRGPTLKPLLYRPRPRYLTKA